MSYLRRIASHIATPHSRDAQPAPSIAVTPSMQIQSPLVEADQRLSIPSFAEIRSTENSTKRNTFERLDGFDDTSGPSYEESAPIRPSATPEPQRSFEIAPAASETSVAFNSEAAAPATLERAIETRSTKVPAANRPKQTFTGTGSQDVIGALSAALSRVDSWLASEQEDSPSASAGSEPSHEARRVVRRSNLAAITPAFSDTGASGEQSAGHRAAARMSSSGKTAFDWVSNGTAPAESVSSAFDPDLALAPRDQLAVSGRMTTPSVASTRAVPISIVTEVVEPIGTKSSRSEGAASVPSEPIRPRPTPPELLTGSPNVTSPPASPTILSIGRIEVEVVPPQSSPAPVISPSIPSRGPRAFRAPAAFEVPRRAFGWRQS